MPQDLSLPPLDSLIGMINDVSSVQVDRTSFAQIFPPEIISAPDGANTHVTFKTTMDFSHAGRVSFQYVRLNLATLFANGIDATVEDNSTFEQYLDAVRQRYGFYLHEDDIALDSPWNIANGELTHTVQVRARNSSYAFIGVANMTVNVNWRLDDPELIEDQTDRLRQLVNFTLPLSISTFLQN